MDFLERNGASRNKDIGEHIERLKKKKGGLKTNVSVRTWNKYLKELCNEGFVKKEYGLKRKDGTDSEYHTYIAISWADREKQLKEVNEVWIEVTREIIKETKENANKLINSPPHSYHTDYTSWDQKMGMWKTESFSALSHRVYSIYTLLNHWFRRYRVYQEFSKGKHSLEFKKTVEESIPEIINELFMILDELKPAQKDKVITEIVNEIIDEGFGMDPKNLDDYVYNRIQDSAVGMGNSLVGGFRSSKIPKYVEK